MRRVRVLPLLAFVALGAVAGGGAQASSSRQIVFASDRDKNDPGEIYAMTLGGAVRDVSRSPAADHDVAAAPGRDLIAFWSTRTGRDRLYLARRDGSRARLVAGVPGSTHRRDDQDTLAFSANGSRLVASSIHGTRPGDVTVYAIDTARAVGHPLRGCTGKVALSPDGAEIACQRFRPGDQFASAVGVLRFGARMRFSVPGSFGLWSADGRLAVAGVRAVDLRGPTGTTIVVDARGTRLGRVGGYPLAWSPDGRQLVLVSPVHTLVATAPRSLASVHQLLSGYDGGGISFVGRHDVLAELPGGVLEVQVPLAGGIWHLGPSPSLVGLVRSPTGRLAYPDFGAARTQRDGLIPIVVTDRNGRDEHVVGKFPYSGIDGDGNAVSLVWAGDRLLAETHTSCGGSDLYSAPAGGGPATRLTRTGLAIGAPAASPDGSRIAYDAAVPCGKDTPTHLETVAADGTGMRRITDNGDGTASSIDEAPAWSPDGTRLVFVHTTAGAARLDSVSATGGPRTELATLDAYGNPGSARPTDGVRVAYEDEGVWTLPVAGGAPVRLAPDPTGSNAGRCGYGGPPAWSPDGSRIALAWDGGIWTLRLGTGASWRLAIHVPCAGEPAWSPDGRRIAFDAPPAGRRTYESDVLVADADGSHLHVVSAAPFRVSRHPTWVSAG